MSYGLTTENEEIILLKAKSKKDGVYTFRGVSYRVKSGAVTWEMKFICDKCGAVEPSKVFYSCPSQADCPKCGERLTEIGGGIMVRQKFMDGEPCGHPGCLHHATHPCEGCGRTAGRLATPEGILRKESEDATGLGTVRDTVSFMFEKKTDWMEMYFQHEGKKWNIEIRITRIEDATP